MAFNFAPMNNLSQIVQDIAAIMPDFITIIIYAGVISFVGIVIAWMKGILRNPFSK